MTRTSIYLQGEVGVAPSIAKATVVIATLALLRVVKVEGVSSNWTYERSYGRMQGAPS